MKRKAGLRLLSIDDDPLDRSPVTLKNYREALKLLSRWLDSTGRYPTDLTDHDMAEWVRNRSRSPAQTGMTLNALKAAYGSRGLDAPIGELTRRAVRLQCRNAPLPMPKDAISPEELRRLVSMSPPDVSAASVLAWHGALRIGEVESLAHPGSHQLEREVLALAVVGKRGRRVVRLIPGLDPELCPLAWYQVNPPDVTWLGIQHRIRRCLKKAGLSTQTHAFRRGWSTYAARAGINAHTMAIYRGDSDVRSAMVYVGQIALEGIPALI